MPRKVTIALTVQYDLLGLSFFASSGSFVHSFDSDVSGQTFGIQAARQIAYCLDWMDSHILPSVFV